MNTELTTAITDLMIFLFCLVSAFVIRRTPTERVCHSGLWQRFFLSCGFAALLGYLYHRFNTGRIVFELIWLLLYPLIFEATRYILFLALDSRFGEERPGRSEKRLIIALEWALCVSAVVLRFFSRRLSLSLCLVFAVVAIVLCLYHYGVLLGQRNCEAWCVFGGLIVSAAGIAVQTLQTRTVRLIWELDNNGVCHLFLLLALSLGLHGARMSLRQETPLPAEYE